MAKDLKETVVKHELLFDEFKKAVNGINAKLNDFFRQLEALYLKGDVPSEFINFRGATEGRIHQLESLVESGNSALKAHKSRIEDLEMELNILSGLHEHTHSDLEDLWQWTKKQFAQHGDHFGRLRTDSDARMESHKATMQRQMEEFKGSLFASPASIVSSNKEVAKSLDEALKGLNNAMQRIQNAFDVMGTLESRIKKLEAKCPSTK